MVIPGIRIGTDQTRTSDQAVGKEREVLHRRTEDRTSGVAEETVVDAAVMGRHDEFAAYILIEVISDTSHCTYIDRRVTDIRGLILSMGSKVGVPQKYIHSRRVKPHRGGCAGSLRAQICDSKTDCTGSQCEP